MAVRSAREAAYETIRSRIITMELKPGDELNDHELAQKLGISRTHMLEALLKQENIQYDLEAMLTEGKIKAAVPVKKDRAMG